MRLGDRGHCSDVDQFQRRVGRRLDEDQLGVFLHRPREVLGIATVDQRRGHAEARHQILDHIAAATEQRPRCNDVVAGPDLAHHRVGHRRHAGRKRPRRFGALEQRHPVLEHVHRRVGEARVVVPLDLVEEQILGVLRTRIGIAGVEEQRLARLVECGPLAAAMHQLRRRRELATVGQRILRVRHSWLQNKKPARNLRPVRARGPFSDLF